ncbi:permease [Brevibacillus ruminantium]|uniref:Permease n=1 Tax=Brevibacillus ruminantium TaxID=2950604 RepID=A0ABY4W9F1_9BACL|nr:permease [Brevibacillus ruminantium]USG63807.1 permease [Brevibacillus ruminantium]
MFAKMRGLAVEILGALLLGAAIWLLLGRNNQGEAGLSKLFGFLNTPALLDVKTLFLSIMLEAIPFVMLGVFFSAFIQTFISEEQVRRWTPKNPLLAIPFAGLLGILFPICECAVIPVVRRLMQKGMPAHVGIVFLLAGPIVNPVVFTSTMVAFQRQPDLAYYRLGLAFVIAMIVGVLMLVLVKKNPLRLGMEREMRHEREHLEASRGKLGATLNHAVDEFFDMGKYLLFGAMISSVLQVLISRETLLSIGQTPLTSHLVMMGMAYVFSLCSEADAFIAASFSNTFHASALLAFLVYGPMLDMKSTMMLFGSFRFTFVMKILVIVTALVLTVTMLVPV